MGRVQLTLEPVFVSPLGLVPKHDGGWRRIYNLSWPKDRSVNDSIPDSASAISYTSIDVFDFIRTAGWGCYIIKRDIKDAFRNIPVATPDRPLLVSRYQMAAAKLCLLATNRGRTSMRQCSTFGGMAAMLLVRVVTPGFCLGGCHLYGMLSPLRPYNGAVHF